ncbi:polysaccharide pyruvyl transferase family protein [Bacillus sp. Marseille-P3800]|uniref:polysaccharide pyruvyl transferase family protein n=1 Tax=Bacillus sp. Marseille-P3800 TaxID=2014782 RepID=UPI00159BD46A|nr:polysaccharide pyruvyl transferase family protein [Bacillus sp. Marseille-P3800]
MKITIISAYTWYNKGDAGILLGTLQAIKKQYPMAKFNILSFTPEEDFKNYTREFDGIEYIESNLLNPYPLKKTKAGKAKAILKLGINKVKQDMLFGLSEKTILERNISARIIKDSDLVFVCGGGFLGGKKFNSIIHLHQINKAAQLNDNVILWGTSVEPPTNKLLKKMTEKSISKIKLILPREEITEKYLSTFLPKEKIIKSPDLAFNLGLNKSERINDLIKEVTGGSKKNIGLTIRDWHFPKSINPKESKNNYFQTICEVIENKTKQGYRFIFIPQVIFTGDDDRIIAKEVHNQLSSEAKANFLVLEGDYSPGELKALISGLDLFLGTRMHSNIFATSVGIPTLAIAYESKTNGIMMKLDMSNYVVDIEDVKTDLILTKLTDLEKDSQSVSGKLLNKTLEFKTNINDIGSIIKSEMINDGNHNIVKRAN